MQDKITPAIDALGKLPPQAYFDEREALAKLLPIADQLVALVQIQEPAVNQQLTTEQESDSDIWPCVNIDVDESGKITNAKLYTPGLPAGNHDVYPVRVPYMDEHTEAWLACVAELRKHLPEFMHPRDMNGIKCAVAAIRELAERSAPVLAAQPATNHSETPNSSTITVPRGWKLVPDDATPEWIANLESSPVWSEAVGECIKKFLAAAPSAPQAAPAAVAVPDAVRDALLQSEAALEVATARILKADPDHSISVTSEAKALVAVRAALAATPAATAQARGGELNQFLSAAKDAGITHLPMSFGEALRELEAATGTVVLPESDAQAQRAEGVEQVVKILKKRADAYADEHLSTDPDTGATEGSEAHMEYWNWLMELVDDVCALPDGVSAPAAQAAPAAQSVANADGRFTKNPVTIDAIKWTGSNLREVIAFTDGPPDTRSIHAGMAWEAYVDLVARDGLKIYTLEGKMLANIGDWIIRGIKGEYYPCKPDIFEATYTSAPQAQDVGRGEVLVTVSGFTGSGKSAIAGEIEILCRALGLQVEWPDSDSEKHMTHADWIAALEQYKPRVRIVECNVPHSVVKGQDK